MIIIVRATSTVRQEDGSEKRGSAQFLTDTETYAHAEEQMFLHATVHGMKDVKIGGMATSNFNDIFQRPDKDYFFSAKCQYHEVLQSGKTMVRKHMFLIQADTIDEAKTDLQKILDEFDIEYKVTEIKESPISDVLGSEKRVVKESIAENDSDVDEEEEKDSAQTFLDGE